MKRRVLIVDDQDAMREGMALSLRKLGCDVVTARSAEEALSEFTKRPTDVVVTDLKMAGMDGVTLTGHLRELEPDVVVIVVTAHGSVEAAVDAMRQGAWDFLEKPFPPEVLRVKVERALEMAHARRKVERLEAQNASLAASDTDDGRGPGAPGALLGESEPIRRLRERSLRAAASNATVLILGESGTGKERVARMLHAASSRKDGPWVAVHCAALAENILESELFGHEKGAFTGAIRRKLGRFELADGGTLFLDEVGELPASVQTKLLRVLQEREIQRVGGERTLPVDVRVVCATHRDLRREVAEGRFREDLFYRLHVVTLALPPLRERPGDIRLLAEHLTRKLAPRINPRVEGLSEGALSVLDRHGWPGNVRELENALEQALVFAEGSLLQPEDLPATLRAGGVRASKVPSAESAADPASDLEVGPQRPLPEVLEAIERRLIERAYIDAAGVKTETARLLGIKPSALYYKLEKYGFLG